MPKQNKKRPAEKPACKDSCSEFTTHPPLDKIKVQRAAAKLGPPLVLKVTIPPPFVPIFWAMVSVHYPDRSKQRAEAMASKAVCKWLLSEDAMQVFDNLANTLTACDL